MECPECKTDNPDSAPVCSLCGKILAARKSAVPKETSVAEAGTNWIGLCVIAVGAVITGFLGKAFFAGFFAIVAVFAIYRMKHSD